MRVARGGTKSCHIRLRQRLLPASWQQGTISCAGLDAKGTGMCTQNQIFTNLHKTTAHSAIISEVQPQLRCNTAEGAQSQQ